MRALVLLILLSTTAAAQTADLRVSVTPVPPRIAVGTTVTWTSTVENLGPDAATNVRFYSAIATVPCFDTTLPALAPGERRSRLCNVPAPPFPYRSAVVAGAQAEQTPDPDLSNNGASALYDLDTPPDLAAFVGVPRAVDPALPFAIGVQYANLTPTEATGVTVAISVPQATGFSDLPANCTANGTTATCALGNVGVSATPWNPWTILTIQPIAPDASQVPIEVTVEIRGNEADVDPSNNRRSNTTRTYRTFFVSNTSDAGPGSLRDAITESAIACSEDDAPCKIAFRIPANGSAWHTIQPLSALPAVRGVNISLDGTTQTRYFGDTNPLGPEVEIRGDQLAGATEGIVLEAGCDFQLSGFTINSFPNAGIRLGKNPCATFSLLSEVAHNYIGTDATGMRAMPNSRGIYIDGPEFTDVHHNVISGNHRSGVFVQQGFGTDVYRNIIGLNANVTAGLGNGASGIYFAAGGRASDAFHNYIAFSAHAGVALHPDAIQCAVTANSYQANGGLAIDFGHDGVSIDIPDPFTSPRLHVPEITSAVYDAARNETIIEGTADPHGETATVYVHANDAPDPSGYGEGQYYLGSTLVTDDGRFRFVWPGRAPGPWIAANLARYTILGLRSPRGEDISAGAQTTSSEFSRTVKVE